MSVDYSKDFFLGDPMLDKVMQVLITVARESYVTRDRLAILEKILEENKILLEGAIDSYKPSALEEARIKERRDEYVCNMQRRRMRKITKRILRKRQRPKTFLKSLKEKRKTLMNPQILIKRKTKEKRKSKQE